MTTTFVRATEIWVPTRDRRALELCEGSYGALEGFRAASSDLKFRYDEGLPGKAWSSRRPVVLPSLDHPLFRRADAARDAGLSTGIAMPIFAGEFLTSVVVFFCGADDALVGAIEVWQEEQNGSVDLALKEGFYGAASSFEWVSRKVHFRPGHGLPGIVWATGMPCILPDLGRTSSFLRADAAVRVGIEHGIGIPCGGGHSPTAVLTFLSGFDTPIAHRFEIWIPNESHTELEFHDGHCDRDSTLATRLSGTTIAKGAGVIGQPLLTGIPAISECLADEEDEAARGAASFELERVMALPILEDGVLRAVVAMYF